MGTRGGKAHPSDALFVDDGRTLQVFGLRSGQELSSAGKFSTAPQRPPVSSGHFRLPLSASLNRVPIAGVNRTILIGGRTYPEQPLFAMDVSDVSALTSDTRAPRPVLWEFDDDDLGIVYGRIAVARVAGNRWAAIFGNGYQMRKQKVAAHGLYVVDVASGELIRKLTVAEGDSPSSEASGLSTPALVDSDGDDVVDHAYAGDLQGNLYKFDLSAQDISKWSVAHNAEPFFRSRDNEGQPQPIIARPEVIRGPYGTAVTVIVAAGPNSLSERQPKRTAATIYGIFDDADASLGTRAGLLRLAPAGGSAPDARLIAPNESTGPHQGWFVDLGFHYARLNDSFERIVAQPVVRDRTLIVMSQLEQKGTCGPVETWITTVSLATADIKAKGHRTAASKRLRLPNTSVAMANSPIARYGPFAAAAVDISEPVILEKTGSTGCSRFIYISVPNGQPLNIPLDCRAGGRQTWRQIH
jgi:Tfp pilus tip-associated adhesin PilY1